MSIDKKLNKAQISKIIQSFQFWFNFGYWLGNLAKKVLANVAIQTAPFGKGAVRAVKEFTLFISNEDM